ncbi:MAG: stage III sporulation protein AF [Clostridia bacterium]|nr:stage III sporulation protein AF [Clostridia bacterium]
MLDIFRNWISSLLCLGIFITFLELVLPNSKIKKYIYSLVGIVTIITIISPLINVYKNSNIESGIDEIIYTISKSSDTDQDSIENNNLGSSLIKQEFIKNIQVDMKNKLENQGINVEKAEVALNDDYTIKGVIVSIKKSDQNTTTASSVNKIVDYMNKEYSIDYSKITVIESGV